MKKRVGGHECLRDEESEEICRKSLGADGEGAGQDVDHVKYKETAQGLQDSDMSLGLSISSAGCTPQVFLYLVSLLCSSTCVLCLVAQSCPALFDPIDCSLLGSPVCGDSAGKNTRVGSNSFL